MSFLRSGLLLALPIVSAVALGCGSAPTVARVYDGRIVYGSYVPSEAYAAYLKGVLAEEAGDLRTALSAYEAAAREDDEDPEPLTRIGDVRCKIDPSKKDADEALAAALRIDRTYAPALAAQARCAAARGRPADGLAVARNIAAGDRRSTDIEALLVRLEARQSSPDMKRGREQAIALTLANGANPVAWDALAAWGRGKSDGELLARGLEGLVWTAPMRSRDVEAGALELLGSGETALARRVAAHLADAPPELGVLGLHDPTVARLAVDEAVLRDDAERAERRAVRGHVALAEVAARALLLEHDELAAKLARSVLEADPKSGCATMVLATFAARDPSSRSKVLPASKTNEPKSDRPAAACVLAMADRLAAFTSAEVGRVWVTNVGLSSGTTKGLVMAPHDPVTGPIAVELAARGVIDEAVLPLELRLELAARRRESPPAVDAVALEKQVDAKHALLWHLLVDPSGSPARTLLSRLSGAAERDPIIGFALARSALASGAPNKTETWAPVFRAIASSPSDPLLLAIAVELAQKGGHAEEVPPARARLMAVARTPAERKLATE